MYIFVRDKFKISTLKCLHKHLDNVNFHLALGKKSRSKRSSTAETPAETPAPQTPKLATDESVAPTEAEEAQQEADEDAEPSMPKTVSIFY